MRWFDRAGGDGARRAQFADVSQTQRRIPSWVPGRSEAERRRESSLKPPKLPSEFVEAVRHELDHEYSSQSRISLLPDTGLRSERPAPASARGASLRAPAAAAPVQVVEALAPPVIDPQLIHAFEQAVLMLGREREQIFSQTAGQLAELAVLIARRVIGRELSLDPSLVRGLVREGVKALGQHDRVHLRLGSGFSSAREQLEEDLRRDDTRFEIHLDTTLDPYACLIETELGQVDESIEARLETLLQALRPESDAP
jgi:hypothetical protein